MSSMARSLPRGASAANAADKRKKLIVLVGGVLLVVLVLFQLMRLGGGSSSSASPASVVGASDPTAAAPPTTGTATSGAGATFATSPAFRRALDKMPAKDPFVPLIPGSTGSAAPSASTGATSPAGGGALVSAPPSSTPAVKAVDPPPVGFSAPDPTPKVAPLPPPTAAVISINGSSQTVARSKLFPAKAPAFRLVTVGRTFVRIGVAGGSFTRGRPTITIRRGQRVTLVNTATGVRYVLRFAAPSMASAEPVSKPATAPAAEGDK